MEMEKLRGPIYFVGICILFAGCAASSGNNSPVIQQQDHSYELEEIQQELQMLRQEVEVLNEQLSDDDTTERTGTKRTY
ncbi:hypothetical protein GLW00_12290 [Halobacillus litoralis]|uniref:Uncharacterized protein n=1 Tax=Halobacillus litoralis TaxID=45668 RepID=A0A845FCV9_9BACI|nr:hypothetical protein [Halobacillus litoralis]MYL71638.1 hypothetical protein [Halobacillus litoralis]